MLLPKRAEVQNLLVLNTPSVSHVAFATVRLEPTLWQLGEGAGIAAVVAASDPSVPAFHDVNIGVVQERLMGIGIQYHFPARANCSAPMYSCASYVVTGAGDAASNGVYQRTNRTMDGAPVWQLSTARELHSFDGQWHIADNRKAAIVYSATGAAADGGPPSSGWTAVTGAGPAPTVPCTSA